MIKNIKWNMVKTFHFYIIIYVSNDFVLVSYQFPSVLHLMSKILFVEISSSIKTLPVPWPSAKMNQRCIFFYFGLVSVFMFCLGLCFCHLIPLQYFRSYPIVVHKTLMLSSNPPPILASSLEACAKFCTGLQFDQESLACILWNYTSIYSPTENLQRLSRIHCPV